MTRPSDRTRNFLPKSPTTEIGPNNQEHQQVGCETLFPEARETFEDFSREEEREFENILEGGQSSSHHTMVDEEEKEKVFEFPIQKTNGEIKMKNINPFSLPHIHNVI